MINFLISNQETCHITWG